MLIATASLGGVATATEDRETGPLGTLVVEDPEGDTTTGRTPWLDVRELWLDSDGEHLTATLVLEDLRETQPADRYEIGFFNDRNTEAGLVGENRDSIECDLSSAEPGDAECRYYYRAPNGDTDVVEVPHTVDVQTDAIQVTVPYETMRAEPGDDLRRIEASSHYDAEILGGGAWHREDQAEALAPYTLAGDAPAPEPGTGPGDRLAEDPSGDTDTGAGWLDLRTLWLDAGEDNLTVTLQVDGLDEGQRGAEYEVRTSDGVERTEPPYPFTSPTAYDELNCDVPVDDVVEASCEYVRRGPGDEWSSHEVPIKLDYARDTIRSTIPYDALGLAAGEDLEVLEAFAFADAEFVKVSDDRMDVWANYTLD